jgi:hypothetical protein
MGLNPQFNARRRTSMLFAGGRSPLDLHDCSFSTAIALLNARERRDARLLLNI